MSSVIVALFLAIGIAGWAYSKITRRTGGLTQSDIIVTAVVGIVVFFIAWSVMGMLPKN
jgi:Na+/glutamate symporter